MARTKKNTEVAVVEQAQVVAVNNSAKKDQPILTLVDTHTMLQKAVEGSKCKVFTDSKFYTGFGVKCNGFSINVKKTKYNVFCNDTAFGICEALKLDGCEYTKGGNSADHTRPNAIECKSTASLMAMVKAVMDQVYRLSTDTN